MFNQLIFEAKTKSLRLEGEYDTYDTDVYDTADYSIPLEVSFNISNTETAISLEIIENNYNVIYSQELGNSKTTLYLEAYSRALSFIKKFQLKTFT